MTPKQIITTANFSTEVYEMDGIRFRIGIIDDIKPFSLAMSFPEEELEDGWIGGLVILAKKDISKYIRRYGKIFASKFVRFIIAHEVGHIVDFAKNPSNIINPNDVTGNLDRESIADAYALNHADIDYVSYKIYCKFLTDEIRISTKELCRNPILVAICDIIGRLFTRKRLKMSLTKIDGVSIVNPIFKTLSCRVIESIE